MPTNQPMMQIKRACTMQALLRCLNLNHALIPHHFTASIIPLILPPYPLLFRLHRLRRLTLPHRRILHLNRIRHILPPTQQLIQLPWLVLLEFNLPHHLLCLLQLLQHPQRAIATKGGLYEQIQRRVRDGRRRCGGEIAA